MLQVSWQQYLTEEGRLNGWLSSKEKEIEDMQRIDASNIDNVHISIKQLQVCRGLLETNKRLETGCAQRNLSSVVYLQK